MAQGRNVRQVTAQALVERIQSTVTLMAEALPGIDWEAHEPSIDALEYLREVDRLTLEAVNGLARLAPAVQG